MIYPQACSCIELFFFYISLSKMICAWAFYSIYLAALFLHMVTILNIIGVACHHLCSINSLTNLTNTDLSSTACTDRVSPSHCSIQGGFPSRKATQILWSTGKNVGVSNDGFSGAAGHHQGHQGFGNVPIFAEDIADQLYRSLGKAHKAFLELGCSTASLAGAVFFVKNGSTLPETNMAPENWRSQKETSIPTIIFRCHVSFREGILIVFVSMLFFFGKRNRKVELEF